MEEEDGKETGGRGKEWKEEVEEEED